MVKLPSSINMSNLALIFDEKHLVRLKCALALSIADHDHDLYHALANAKPVAEPVAESESCETQEEDAANERRFIYGDIVGSRRCRDRAVLPQNELYVVVSNERCCPETQVEVIPFSACTSKESAVQQSKYVDVAYLSLKIAADDRKLFTVKDVVSEQGETSYNVLTPDGALAASFHDFEGSNGMAAEFADRFCDDRNEACLFEYNGDYELIFPTEEELKQLNYNQTHEQ